MDEALRDKFAALGADDPASWADSELRENIPQLARFRFLRGMWSIIDEWGPPAGGTFTAGDAARRRLEELGATQEDLQAFARMVAHDALFSALCFLDDPTSEGDVPGLPGWALIETSGGELTGRLVQGVYEDLGPDR
ncbi:hypothetical protein ACIA8G_27930 [Lentzea sp. NPDC051213]|uniref:hypothetical protein n=1 Tax=Lentzea sp. NPDC051213 TaxID=3364126 RepID=UPI0037A160A1